MTPPKIGQFSKERSHGLPSYNEWSNAPSEDNFKLVLKDLKPTISAGLRSYGGGSKDLNTRANILAAQAVKSYDPSKGASLNTHVFTNLQRLQRYRAQRSYAVHIPENVHLDRGLVTKYITKYTDQHGYDPDTQTIADSLNMSSKRVMKARRNMEGSVSQSLSEKGDLPGQERDAQHIWMDYVYHDLSPSNRKIFEWTTGYNETARIPKKDIAKHLKISPAAVSMRITGITNKLQQYHDSERSRPM